MVICCTPAIFVTDTYLAQVIDKTVLFHCSASRKVEETKHSFIAGGRHFVIISAFTTHYLGFFISFYLLIPGLGVFASLEFYHKFLPFHSTGPIPGGLKFWNRRHRGIRLLCAVTTRKINFLSFFSLHIKLYILHILI